MATPSLAGGGQRTPGHRRGGQREGDHQKTYLVKKIICVQDVIYFRRRRIKSALYFFDLRVRCPKAGRPHGVTG